MDRRFKLSLLGSAIFAAAQFTGAATTGASAADLLPPPAIVEAPEIVQRSNTGWYLRGDISYDFHKVEGYHYTQAINSTNSFDRAEIDDSVNLSLGIGYQITDHLRVDLTGDYVFSADMNGSSCVQTVARVCGGGAYPGQPTGTYFDNTSVERFDLLANAYLDLGTYGSFTPYVGAGIGGSHVNYDQLINRAPDDPISTETHDGLSSWRFAYALHAGAAISLSSNLKLDLGYTYKNIEGGASHGFGNRFAQAAAATGKPLIYDEGFQDHVVRAGLRYQFGGGHH